MDEEEEKDGSRDSDRTFSRLDRIWSIGLWSERDFLETGSDRLHRPDELEAAEVAGHFAVEAEIRRQ